MSQPPKSQHQPPHQPVTPLTHSPNPAYEFGRLVRMYRREQGRSLTWLARATGMDAGYLSRMERGKLATLPLPETIDRLAGALGLAPWEHRALYTAVGELTDDMYRLALRVQGHTQLYRLALILSNLPTVTLLKIGQRYYGKLKPEPPKKKGHTNG